MDNRKALHSGTTISENGKGYIIGEVLGIGATSIVYEGVDKSGHGRVIIKECYPDDLGLTRDEVTGEINSNADSFAKFVEAIKCFDEMRTLVLTLHDKKGLTNFSSTEIAYIKDKNTRYLVTDIRDGMTYSEFLNTNRDSLTLSDIVTPVYYLTHLTAEYHKNGFLILDIKKDNFYVTDIGGHPNNIQLFDVGSIIKKEQMEEGFLLTQSEQWAAPELRRRDIRKIDERTDVYGLGATLFDAVMGRHPKVNDFSMPHVIYDFDSALCPKCVRETKDSPEIRELLKRILSHTVVAYKGKRYQSAQELAEKLRDLLNKLSMNDAERREFSEINKRLDKWHEGMLSVKIKIDKVDANITLIGDKISGIEETTVTTNSRMNELTDMVAEIRDTQASMMGMDEYSHKDNMCKDIENGVKVKGITCLSIEEAEFLPKEMLASDWGWWLRSPGYEFKNAAFMSYTGEISESGSWVCVDAGVRPALITNTNHSKRGKKIELFGYTWTVIRNDMMLCDDIIGMHCFQKKRNNQYSNVWESSDLKKWIESWYVMQVSKGEDGFAEQLTGIKITTAGVSILSEKEYEKVPPSIRRCDCDEYRYWWLKPEPNSDESLRVVNAKNIHEYRNPDDRCVVRPILKLAQNNSDFAIYDKVSVMGYTWTFITPNTLLCDTVTGEHHFLRGDGRKPEYREWEKSDLKKWIEGWYGKRLKKYEIDSNERTVYATLVGHTRKGLRPVDITLPDVDDVSLIYGWKAVGKDMQVEWNRWWLRSAGSDSLTVKACLTRYGEITLSDESPYEYLDVIPLLILDPQSHSLVPGELAHMFGHSWTIISSNKMVCNESLFRATFRYDRDASDANQYEKSDVKRYVEHWYNKQLNAYKVRTKGITCLSIDEVRTVPIDVLRKVNKNNWGLRSKPVSENIRFSGVAFSSGNKPHTAAFPAAMIRREDDKNFLLSVDVDTELLVRPALIIEVVSDDLHLGDEVDLFGYTWTMISSDLLLCNDVVGKTVFRQDTTAPDADEWDASDLKAWIENWYCAINVNEISAE